MIFVNKNDVKSSSSNYIVPNIIIECREMYALEMILMRFWWYSLNRVEFSTTTWWTPEKREENLTTSAVKSSFDDEILQNWQFWFDLKREREHYIELDYIVEYFKFNVKFMWHFFIVLTRILCKHVNLYSNLSII